MKVFEKTNELFRDIPVRLPIGESTAQEWSHVRKTVP